MLPETDFKGDPCAQSYLTTRSPAIMADLGRSRTTASNRSRTRSRPSSPHLHRFFSSQHIDDQSVYHGHQDIHSDDDSTYEGSDLSQHTTEKDDLEARAEGEGKVGEVRDGVPAERDVEAGRPPLEKKRTTRSIKDPNLVGILSETGKAICSRTDVVLAGR